MAPKNKRPGLKQRFRLWALKKAMFIVLPCMTHPKMWYSNFDPYPILIQIYPNQKMPYRLWFTRGLIEPLWFGTSGVGQWAVSRRMFMRMRCQTPEGSQAGIWIYSRSQLCNYSILFVHWGPVMTSANNCKWRDDVRRSFNRATLVEPGFLRFGRGSQGLADIIAGYPVGWLWRPPKKNRCSP